MSRFPLPARVAAALLAVGCDQSGAGDLGDAVADPVLHPENTARVTLPPSLSGQSLRGLGGPDARRLMLSAGVLRFVSAPDFENPDDADQDGIYRISLELEGSSTSETLALAISVLDVDEAPVFVGPFDYFGEENDPLPILLRVIDPEGSRVTVSISGGDDAARFAVIADDRLAFVTPPDYEAPADDDRDNVYEVRLIARDPAANEATAALRVIVTDVPDGVEPSVEVLFPPAGARLAASSEIAVLVELDGWSSAVEVTSVGADGGARPLTPVAGFPDRFTGRLASGATSGFVRAEEAGRVVEAAAGVTQAPFVLGQPLAVGTSPSGGPTWILDGVGPRLLVWRPGRTSPDVIRLPALAPRDVEPLAGGADAYLLTDERLWLVRGQDGAATPIDLPPFTAATAVALSEDGPGQPYVLDAGRLILVRPGIPEQALVSGPGRGVGPSLVGGIDLAVAAGVAFVQVDRGRQGRAVLRVDLDTGDRRELLALAAASSNRAFGLAGRAGPTSAGEVWVLNGPRLVSFLVDDGQIRSDRRVLDEAGQPLNTGRLGAGPAPAAGPAVTRRLPALFGLVEGEPARVQPVFDQVGDGPGFGPIEDLAVEAGGRRLQVLRRGGLGAVTLTQPPSLRRTTVDVDLTAPVAFWASTGATIAALVADRDADAILRVDRNGNATPLPDPAADVGRGFDAPIAVAGVGEDAEEVWAIEAVPPTLLRFRGGAWSIPFPDAELGFVAASHFEMSEPAVYLFDGARAAVVRLSLTEGDSEIVSSPVRGQGPPIASATDLAVSADGLFVLGGRGATEIFRVDAPTGDRALVSGRRGVGPSLQGATSLDGDGRGRLFVGRSDGAVLAVDVLSGDRVFVGR